MKKLMHIAAGIYLTTIHLCATTAEWSFHVQNNSANKFIEISVMLDESYSWTWRDNQVVLHPYFSQTDTTRIASAVFKYDSPKSEGHRHLPWGVMRIIIHVDGALKLNKSIDFRDEEWATDGSKYPSADAGIVIDVAANTIKVYTSRMGGAEFARYFQDGDSTIWNIWNTSAPHQVSFLPPIFLRNLIGSSNSGGSLHINSLHYASGDTVLKAYNTNYTIGTDNERYTNYLGGGTTYKNNNWNNISSDYLLSRNITVTSENAQQDARFVDLSLAYVKAQLLENNAVGEVEIRDPWYVSNSSGSQPNTFFPVTSASNYVPTGKYNLTTGGVFLNQLVSNGTYYSVNAPSPKTISGIPSHFRNWSATTGSATFQNANAQSTAVVFNSSGTTLTANYKGSLASNTSTAMSQPSQRKIVRGNTGAYILAYESMGIVWAEYSTNEGTTWQLANNNQPIGGGTSPAVTPHAEGALVVFLSGGNPVIYRVAPTVTEYYGYLDDEHESGFIATPVISQSQYQEILVMWKSTNGIRYSIGQYLPVGGGQQWGMVWSVIGATISGSNSGSSSPTVEAYGNTFHIAWQHIYMGSTVIFYTSLTRQANGTYTQGSTIQMSGSYTTNTRPSLIAVNGGARVCWIGTNGSTTRTVFHDPGYYVYWYFGTGVTSASINQAPGSAYVIGWVDNDGTHHYTHGGRLYDPHSLSSSGSSVQIVNSNTGTTLRSLGFNTSLSPYRFNFSSQIPLYKSNSNAIGTGRGGIVAFNGAQFMFMLGDVSVNGERIHFIDMPDTVKFNGAASLNKYLETESFTIAGNAPLNYGVEYWTQDSAAAVAVLSKGKKVTFTVEMIDAKTKNVIGTFDKCMYKSSQVVSYKNQRYEVNTKGIESRQVKLRLHVEAGSDAEFAVVNAAAEGSVLAKDGGEAVKVDLSDAMVVTTYALEQNYPNPFNPSTTITYQIPRDGMVTIKIYDALGREVQTLVNEQKSMGRYSVAFNAGDLASGLYVYKIVAVPAEGEKKDAFTAVKKMVLLK